MKKSDNVNRNSRKIFSEALAMQKNGQYKEAQLCYQRLLVVEPDYEDAILNNAIIYCLLGDYEKAREGFTGLLSRKQLHVEAMHNMGMSYYLQDRWEEALPFLSNVAEKANAGQVVERALAYSYLRTENYEKTANCCLEYLNRYDKDTEVALWYSLALLKQNNFRMAEQFLRQLIEFDSSVTGAYELLANCYQMQGKMEKAVTTMKRLLLLNNEDKEACLKLCGLYEQLGQHDEAAKCREHIYELEVKKFKVADKIESPSSTLPQVSEDMNQPFQESVLAITEHYSVNDDWKGALREFAQLARRYPDSSILLQEIAYIYQCSGEFRRAAGYYEKILDKEPKNLEALLQLIRISMDLSDLKYGETFAQIALSEYPHVMEVHELVGLFYISFQDYEKASHHFDCCQTNGHLSGGVLLGRSQCYLNMRRFEEAATLLKEGIEQFSDYADLQLNLVLSLIGLEQWKEAEQVLALIRDRFPSNINVWYLSVRVAIYFSDYQKASRYWEKLSTLQPRERGEYVPYLKSLIFLRKPDIAMKLLKNFTRYRFKEFDSLLLESLIHIQKRNRFHFGISWQELWAAHTQKIQEVAGEIRSLLSKEDVGFMMQLQPEISRLFVKKTEICSGIQSFFVELTGS